MKKLFILLFIATTIVASGQIQQRLYLATQPFDFGLGLRYDFCPAMVGLYGSASYGNGNLYRLSGLQHHIKLTAGLMVSPDKKRNFYITAGANYHYADLSHAQDFILETPIQDRWSFEIGVTREIFKRFSVGFRTDVLRWEPCVDFGIRL